MLWPGAVFVCLFLALVLYIGFADQNFELHEIQVLGGGSVKVAGDKVNSDERLVFALRGVRECFSWSYESSPTSSSGLVWKVNGAEQIAFTIYADKTYTLAIAGNIVDLRKGFIHLRGVNAVNCYSLAIYKHEIALRFNNELVWHGSTDPALINSESRLIFSVAGNGTLNGGQMEIETK